MAQLQTTAVTGSLTVTGQITAQTLNVQQVTSSIVYSSGSNRFGNLVTDVQQMTGSLRVTGSGIHYIVGGSVGIGTVLPSYRVQIDSPSGDWGLHVKGVSTTNSSYGMFIDAGTSTSDAAFMVRSADTTTTFFRIIGNGNIGIGTTSPNAAFNIVTPAADTTGDAFVFKGSNGKEFVSINKLGFIRSRASDTNGANMHFIDNTGNKRMEMGINSTIMSWYSDALASTFMVFQHSSGNVGIGTTSPGVRLTLYVGSGAISGTNDALRLQVSSYSDTARNTIAWHQDNSNLNLGRFGLEWNATSSQMNFVWRDVYNTAAASTELMRLTGGGNLGINTTTPAARLQVSGSSNVLNVKGSGSLSTSSLFSVDGAFGRLFEVTDDLSNSLFSVNTIAGLPVIEAFADYSVNLGTYSAASGSTMRITGSSVGIGTTNPAMNLQIDSTGFSFRLRERSDGSSLVLSGNQIQARTSANGGSALYLNFTNSGEIYTGAGNVGIGTTSTTRKVTVWQTIDGQYAQYIYHGGTNGSSYGLLIDAGATSVDAGLRVRSKAGTDYFIIKGDGNVGIGTTLPSRVLYVSSSVWDNTAGAGVIFDNSNTVGAGLTLKPNASVVTNGSSGWAMYAGGPGAAIGDGNLGFWAHGTNQARLLIQRDGNVGIGTTTTANTLHVHGTSDGLGYIRITDSVTGATSTDGVRIGYNSGVLRLQNYENSDIQFLTNNTTEAIRIKSDGNVGIGTTSPVSRLNLSDGASMYAAATGEMLQIKRNVTNGTDAGQVRLTLGNNSNTFAIVYGGTTDRLRFIDGGLTEILSLVNGGNVGIGSIAPDARLTVSASSGDLATFYTGTTKRLTITTGGNLSFNTSTSLGLLWSPASLLFEGQTLGITARPFASNYVSFTVAGATSQTANLQTWQSQAGTVYSAVNATGSFGIGTSTPAALLHVSGTSGGLLEVDGVNATNALYVSSSGFVGIGTVSPLHPLDVTSAGNTILYIRAGSVTSLSRLVFGTSTNTDRGFIDYDNTAASRNISFKIAEVERVRILADGNVGIGTTSPGQKLQVEGSLLVNTGTSAAAYRDIMIGGIGGLSVGESHGIDFVYNTAASPTTFARLESYWDNSTANIYFRNMYRAGAPRTDIIMTVRGTGNVGIGTTTTTPSASLDVWGGGDISLYTSLLLRSGNSATNFNANQITFGYNNTGDYKHAIKTRHASSAVAGNAIDFYTWKQGTDTISTVGTQHVMSIDGPNVGIGTTTPSTKLHVSGTSGGVFEVDGANSINGLYVSSSGEVGIGTTTTQANRLFVANNISSYPFSTAGFLSTSATASFNIAFSGGTSWVNGYVSRLTFQSDTIPNGAYAPADKWFVGINATADGVGNTALVFYDAKNNAERVRVDANGNVGIGSTAPAYKLDVAGAIRTTSNILLPTDGMIDWGSGDARIVEGEVSNYSLSFKLYDPLTTTVPTRLFMSASGNIGIGTTSPAYRLQVEGTSYFSGSMGIDGEGNGITVDTGYGNNGRVGIMKYPGYEGMLTAGSGTPVRLGHRTDSATVATAGTATIQEDFRIQPNGNVGINTTLPTARLHVQGTTVISGSLSLSGSAVGLPEHMVVALSDETTNITTGTAKVTMRAPFAMRLTDLPRASLSTASTSGLVTVDINEAGTSVLGANKLSIDANELTSTTAATPTTIADALIADDAQITFDIDGAGTGAKGLKVTLYYIRV